MSNQPSVPPTCTPPEASVRTDALWLCRLDDIPDGGTRGLCREGNDDRLIACRTGSRVRVYRNDCPHQHRPLEYRRDHFLAPDGKALMCYAHGSRFCIDTGECFVGPAKGRALRAVPVRVLDGEVWLAGPLPDVSFQ